MLGVAVALCILLLVCEGGGVMRGSGGLGMFGEVVTQREGSFLDLINVTVLHLAEGKTYNLAALPVVKDCDYILFTSHNPKRLEDGELDNYRRRWVVGRANHCMFHVDLPVGRELDEEAIAAWRRRGSPNDPRVLVFRYRVGLILLWLLESGRIRTSGGSEAVFMYVDGDTMFANNQMGVDLLVERLRSALDKPSTEDRVCGTTRKLFPCLPEKIGFNWLETSLAITVSNNCHRGYNTHSGAMVFKYNPIIGFLFDALSESPYLPNIDTDKFRMGDQAIWDLLLRSYFNMDWSRLHQMCLPANRPVTRIPCNYPEVFFRRKHSTDPFNSSSTNMPQQFQHIYQKWLRSLPSKGGGGIALLCVRWFNAPGCPLALVRDPLHAYHCGDFLWHLYGCSKKSWKGPTMRQLMQSDLCADLCPNIPPLLPLPSPSEP